MTQRNPTAKRPVRIYRTIFQGNIFNMVKHMNANGKSLELFFIDGKPDGMLTAEVFNWTGHVLKIPRLEVLEGLKREEAQYTGIYLLLGEKDDGPCVYVGESDNIGDRISKHIKDKEWWSTGSAILITTVANRLNKAHIRYLEARLIKEGRKIGKISFDNGTTPEEPSLSEAARANMEVFLDHILMVLPALRIDCFSTDTRQKSSDAKSIDPNIPIFVLDTPKHNIHAVAKREGGEFIVQAKSKARIEWTRSPEGSYGNLFNHLVSIGILAVEGNNQIFTKNYAFKGIYIQCLTSSPPRLFQPLRLSSFALRSA